MIYKDRIEHIKLYPFHHLVTLVGYLVSLWGSFITNVCTSLQLHFG